MLIYLVDLTHESKLGLGSDTMPLQLGLIGSYCLKQLGNKVEIKIFKFVNEFSDAFQQRRPDVIGASNYLWNTALTSAVFKEIKRNHPEIITICGGPNYPEDLHEQIDWFKSHPETDFYIYKDGEVPFAGLIARLLTDRNLENVKKAKLPSCHSLVNDEHYFGDLTPRLTDLSVVPSPYTLGLMDKFFEQKLIPAIRTNRGCPFTCSYCTEGNSYYNIIAKTTLENKFAEVEYIAQRAKHTSTLRIADSNFGMYDEDVVFCSFLADLQKQYNFPQYLNCSTGKNRKELILKCNEYLNGAIRLTASVQSLDPTVLKLAHRTNISLDDIISLSMKVSDTDTHAYSEIILSLPGDTLQAEKDSMAGLIKAGISNITQHQLSMISGSAVNLPETRKEHGVQTMYRPIQRCLGRYKWENKELTAIEIEEICVANNTLSFDDYLEARKYYLTIGLFYNDRILREIHALLYSLKLPTWEWLSKMHDNIKENQDVRELYDGFVTETKNELWQSREQLISDVTKNIDKYESGEIGGNIIYKYRAKMLQEKFEIFHKFAFDQLRQYLTEKGADCPDLINDLEKFSWYSKLDIFNTDFEITLDFNYDIVRLLKDYLKGGARRSFQIKTKIRLAHSDQQKELIRKQLDFYGSDLHGVTMIMSRFPIKRFYRKAVTV